MLSKGFRWILITQTTINLPNVLSEFQRFGTLSNFKINASKSEVQNITLTSSLEFSFKVQNDFITYLRTHITNNPSKPQSKLSEIKLSEVSKDLMRWGSASISWFDHLSILKIDILPTFSSA